MAEPLKQAMRDTLVAYLKSQLASAWPQLVVSGDWPAPGAALPPQAITVLTPGTPKSEFHIPQKASFSPIGSPGPGQQGLVTYTYAYVEQGMQLDLWTRTQPDRDALEIALEQALNRPAVDTLGIAVLPHYQRRKGARLTMAGLFNMPVEYRFEAAPSFPDDSDAAASGEWRATWTGTADAYACDQQQVAVLRQIIIQFNGETIATIT